MKTERTALLLIGFQNDYFSEHGILHSVIEESAAVSGALDNTLELLRQRGKDFDLVLSTPIIFTDTYAELDSPTGILKTIKEVGAFKKGSPGSEAIAELEPFAQLITELPGKRGLNAFSNTNLAAVLDNHRIERLVLAGAVTSVCIDSTARHAADLGYAVTVLSNCTSGRTVFEQEFYCDNIFPLYAEVVTSHELSQ